MSRRGKEQACRCHTDVQCPAAKRLIKCDDDDGEEAEAAKDEELDKQKDEDDEQQRNATQCELKFSCLQQDDNSNNSNNNNGTQDIDTRKQTMPTAKK
ncbi:hypothetical protein ACLKA7_006363 [Drosophila subpalustris]